MMTSSTSFGLDLGALHRRLERDSAQRHGRAGSTSAPLNDPTGVRAAETMTTPNSELAITRLLGLNWR